MQNQLSLDNTTINLVGHTIKSAVVKGREI